MIRRDFLESVAALGLSFLHLRPDLWDGTRPQETPDNPTGTAFRWIAEDGDWDDSHNWLPHGVPGHNDDVTIDIPAGHTFRITGSRPICGSMTLQGDGMLCWDADVLLLSFDMVCEPATKLS